MTTLFRSLPMCLCASLFAFQQAEGQTPLYFNIVSHNEASDPLDYDGSFSDHMTIRPLIKALCDTIISKQAKYNMQVDANFIKAVLQWENANMDPNDLLEWANNSPYIDVDGHNHFRPVPGPAYNPYNYSDLAHLLDSCGVVLARKILGGVTYADTTVGGVVMTENWTQYSTPCPGFSFPGFQWQAEIVWGSASPGHVADLTKFGIWKPKGGTSPSEFVTHEPTATITHIGGGCKQFVGYILDQNNQLTHSTEEVITNVLQTADHIQSLPTSSNDHYTMNMLINFRDMPNIPGFVDSISAIIEGIRPYVDQGKVVWATLSEKYDIWYATHTDPNDHFKYDCADIPLGADAVDDREPGVRCFPNPTNGSMRIECETGMEHHIALYNTLGACLFTDVLLGPTELDLGPYQKGIYFLTIDKIKTMKLVLN